MEAPEDFQVPRARIAQDPVSATEFECSYQRYPGASGARQTSETQDKLHTENPELQSLVRDLRDRFAGFPGIRSRYRLSSHDFARLNEYLEKVGWDNMRYDYFIDTQDLVLRMPPSDMHESVHAQLILLLLERLKQLCSSHQIQCPFSTFASAAVKDEQGSTLMPDNQIRCKNMKKPVLVLEIGDSQSMDSLNNKAFRYIQAGRGNVRYVVALKLHRDSQAVDLTLATPKFTSSGQSTVLEAEITSQAIRNVKGEPGSGAGLSISVGQMAPSGLLPGFICRETIVVSVEELCEIIQSAEDSEKAIEEGSFEDVPADFIHASPSASSKSIELDEGDDDTLSIHGGDQGKRTTADDIEFKLDRTRYSTMPYRSPIKTRAT
ncbi:hypothetical protein LTS15_006808 [Exophiala xenobiotica]|nr:hypothetical protein LTS15_006808 [Exophiala xenobiotica]